MTPAFTRVDGAAGRVIEDVHALRVAAHAADTPHLPRPCFADFEGSLAVRPPATEVEEWAVYDGGECVACARLEFPQEENTGTATAAVFLVHPAGRGRGWGGRLAAFARRRAEAHDCFRVLLVADAADAAHASGEQTAASAQRFADRIGARLVSVQHHLRLDVGQAPRPEPVRGPLRLRFWASTVPGDLVADAARLEAALSADAPTGGLDREPQPAAVSRIRDFERMRAARRRRAYQCGVVDDGTGRMVAWTGLSMTRTNPDNALQAVTVVDRAYRGRGLGRLVKAHNLAVCRAGEPRLTHVDTWNAEENVHMLRINSEFGYRRIGARLMWVIGATVPAGRG
ncbi:GNAT family N-acetyltransferase [Streptomyces sp. NPDC002588]|uniref:GNAT family N-acetyltransferase n=1 Tax=Streptomyces sp. NPDC002588 TaxID=3154419 RepID=UPI0033310BE9